MNKGHETMVTPIDRREVLPALFPDPAAPLFVSGLAGASRDAAALTRDGANLFALGGAMGAAAMIGMGLAMGAPSRRVVVVTGDGELLMNVGSLVTIANRPVPNLSIICLDNGRHGETGNQPGHTALRTDLAAMARAAGFEKAMAISQKGELDGAAKFLGEQVGPKFLVVRVSDGPPSAFRRLMDPIGCRWRFMRALGSPR